MNDLYIFLVSKIRGQKTVKGQYETSKTPLRLHFLRCFTTLEMRETGETK